MNTRLIASLVVSAGCLIASVRAEESSDGPVWIRASPGYEFRFPRDHHSHPGFQTEWWYFTGNLRAGGGGADRPLGYQLTFFRQGIRPPGSMPLARSRFIRDDFYFAHLAISDPGRGRFAFQQKVSRGAFGEAGVGAPGGEKVVWIEDWELKHQGSQGFVIRARSRDPAMALELELEPVKPPVFHGANGVSQKAAGAGNASHYYSFTRMHTRGTLSLRGENILVDGESWFDREWATNQLAPDQTGWDWIALRLDCGAEVMLYQLRKADGSADPFSSGTWVEPGGASAHLSAGEFSLRPVRIWKSPVTGAPYPVEWEVQIPARGVSLKLRALMDDQELRFDPVSYWEGQIEARGTKGGAALSGVGYLEMTGYGRPLDALRERGER